jgi:hypothetical protein
LHGVVRYGYEDNNMYASYKKCADEAAAHGLVDACQYNRGAAREAVSSSAPRTSSLNAIPGDPEAAAVAARLEERHLPHSPDSRSGPWRSVAAAGATAARSPSALATWRSRGTWDQTGVDADQAGSHAQIGAEMNEYSVARGCAQGAQEEPVTRGCTPV